jgi:hypothetical protein
MNIIEELKSKSAKPEVLLLANHKDTKQVKALLEERYDKFGIRNTTVNYLKEQVSKANTDKLEEKKKVAQNEMVKLLINTFGVYKVIEYKELDAVAKRHNLHISALSNYNKAIPDENIEELDGFTEYLKTLNESFLKEIRICKNNDFSFENSNRNQIHNMGFDEMFYIMAPKSHLNIDSNSVVIGREISNVKNKPAFSYEFKVNKPEPIDPIIYMVVKMFEKTFAVVITAWDKVADDTAIRQMI